MDYKKEYEKWKNFKYLEPELRKELDRISDDDTAIKNQFSSWVEFGTGGMRGHMGVGPNCLNIYTIRRATLGIVKYIIANKKEQDGVCIVYDTRNNSKSFATYTAKVLASFGIKVYISKDVRPTPFLSFAVLNMKAYIGINITASHNRKEDNGFKVYLYDGAQFSYPDDQKIISLASKTTDKELFVDNKNIKYDKRLISYIPKNIENAYLDGALASLLHKDFCKKYGKDLCVVYTPLHGTGYTFLETGFKKSGFTNVHVVKEQNDKNGNFKTVASPNPEFKEAYELALKLAKKVNADIIVATDPDADREGVYVKTKDNEYLPLTGNELNSIIFEYICQFRKREKSITNCYAAKSFVTTRMLDAIAKRYGVELIETPTGFKWICKEMNKQKKDFTFACEESFGCIISDYVRDKDAIGATLFILEMALVCKKSNFTLYDIHNLLYNQYGVYKNYAMSITYEGVSGKQKIDSIMKGLIDNPFKKLADIETIEILDYNNCTRYNLKQNKKEKFDFVKNNSIRFLMSDDTSIMIRPSGTEPKIKMYFDIKDESEELADNKNDILRSALEKVLN